VSHGKGFGLVLEPGQSLGKIDSSAAVPVKEGGGAEQDMVGDGARREMKKASGARMQQEA
jgi:hypothetical protein